MLSHILIYLLSFLGIWFGAGITISSVEKLSRRLHTSSFLVSFLLLGLLTSLSELSVGVNSVLENDPEIYVGNLIGASIVVFLFVIPLLVMAGKEVRINPKLQGTRLLAPLAVVSLPVILSLDGKVDRVDGLICLGAFALSAFWVEAKKAPQAKQQTVSLGRVKFNFTGDLLKILAGLIIIFVCSHFVVQQTMYFADLMKLSPFLVSLLVVSVGTNLPELSLVIRSVFSRNKQVAFGDFIGSASYNTLILGGLTLWYGKTVYLTNSYLVSLTFLIAGLIIFYLFARSKNTLSRREGFYLFLLYLLFLGTEVLLHLKP